MATHAELWATQVREWPDSVELSTKQITALIEQVEAYPPEEYWKQDKGLYSSMVQTNRAYAKLRTTHWVTCALLNERDSDQKGVFYACGKRLDGTYNHIGWRYGVEGSHYMSGFGANAANKSWVIPTP